MDIGPLNFIQYLTKQFRADFESHHVFIMFTHRLLHELDFICVLVYSNRRPDTKFSFSGYGASIGIEEFEAKARTQVLIEWHKQNGFIEVLKDNATLIMKRGR